MRSNAALLFSGTLVIQSYANWAGTVGVAAEVCVATDALTCAHGEDAYWRALSCRGVAKAIEAKEKPTMDLRDDMAAQ